MSSDTESGPAASQPLHNRLAADVLEASVQGYALVDSQHRIRYVNEAGARMLEIDPDGAIGQVLSQLPVADATVDAPSGVCSTVIECPDGPRVIEYHIAELSGNRSRLNVITFSDVTDARQKERQFRAFARTASSVTYATSVSSVLDVVAREARNATGVVGCVALLLDLEKRTIQASPAGNFPADLAERLKTAWDLGMPLGSVEAMMTRRTVTIRHMRQVVMKDERWKSVDLPAAGEDDWDSVVVAPMIVRGQVIGALCGTYRRRHDPSEDDVAFLTAMADQAAVALDNANLVSELEAKAALEERHRIARDLHDSISQGLFSLALQARTVELLHERGCADNHEQLVDGLKEIRDLTHGVLAEMRALIFQLRPDALHEEGLIAAIRRHGAAVAARTGLDICVAGDIDTLAVSDDVETDLFRIAQEALQNVVKHGEATSVVITVEPGGEPAGGLRMTVADDGVGFDPSELRPGHLGLTSMSERARRLGGDITIESSRDGTSLNVVIPNVSGTAEARGRTS